MLECPGPGHGIKLANLHDSVACQHVASLRDSTNQASGHRIITVYVNSSMNNKHLSSRDLAVLWHPCTQMQDHETIPMIPIRSARGAYLTDYDDTVYLDAISSWWVNLFGHCHPGINEAIADQLEKLEHVILAGFSHEPAIELAERLVQLTPPGLDKVFYADNGSSAVEVAMKMSFHYWQNVGQPERKRFINLGNSYHGETIGALAVGDVELYKQTYEPLLLKPITVASPDCYHREEDVSWEQHSRKMFEHMEQALREHANEACAVILEPLVQCAGYMRMYHPVYLELLREACDRYNIHLIADEIAVGFGRTGTLFACEQANVSPDFMCLSKGLTGGYLPLSAVMTTNTVYDAFYDNYQSLKAFLHSHSYTGNALACRTALAVLDIFETQPVLENNLLLAQRMKQQLAPLNDHPNVGDVRQTGMIAAFEMVRDRSSRQEFPWTERRGVRVYEYALTQGVLLRPLGNTIYFMPPYIVTNDEIDRMVAVAIEGLGRAVS